MKTQEVIQLKFDFVCPKCGATPHKHGKGGVEKCIDRHAQQACEGLICECDPQEFSDCENEDHGQTFVNMCTQANCYHCGWGGTVPKKPKGLQAWEKKALDAGWSPPAERARELSGA